MHNIYISYEKQVLIIFESRCVIIMCLVLYYYTKRALYYFTVLLKMMCTAY